MKIHSFSFVCISSSLSKIRSPYVCKLISVVSIWFHWLTSLFFCYCFCWFANILLLLWLKLCSTAVLSLFRIVFLLLSFVVFPYKAENCLFSFCEELCWSFISGCVESIDCFLQVGQFYYSSVCSPWAWNMSLSSDIVKILKFFFIQVFQQIDKTHLRYII